MQPHTRPFVLLALQTALDFLCSLPVDGHTNQFPIFVIQRPKAGLAVTGNGHGRLLLRHAVRVVEAVFGHLIAGVFDYEQTGAGAIISQQRGQVFRGD